MSLLLELHNNLSISDDIKDAIAMMKFEFILVHFISVALREK